MTGAARALAFCTLLALIAAASPAFGEGEEDRFSWHPSVAAGNFWEDNPLLEDGGSGDDVGFSILPRLELGWNGPGLELGADLGVELRRYIDESSLDDEWYRMRAFGEVGLLPGLIVRVSDAYVPEPRQLGLPPDSSVNLLQTNRSDAEIRYWHGLPWSSEVEVGVRGTYFLSDGFDAAIPLDGGGFAIDDDFHADFWQGSAFLQAQTSLGRLSSLFLMGQVGYRDFQDGDRSDHLDTSVMVGLRSQRFRSLELEVAIGYGRISFDRLSDEQAVVGRGSVRWRLPGGWTWRLEGSNDFASNLVGNEVFEARGEIGLEKELGEHATASLAGFVARFDDEALDVGEDLYGGLEAEIAYRFNQGVRVGLTYQYWINRGDADLDDYEYNTVGLRFSYRY